MSTNFYLSNSTSSSLILSTGAATLRIHCRSTWNPDEAQIQYAVMFINMRDPARFLQHVMRFRQFVVDRHETLKRHRACIDCLPRSNILEWYYLIIIIIHISSTEYDNFAIIQTAPKYFFSTDRDETLTRHDFRPWFIRVYNFQALAKLIHYKLAWTKCLASEKKKN